MKICSKCKKSDNEFRPNRAECKKCESAYRKKYFKSKKGKQAVKRYQTSPKGRIAKQRADKKYREKIGYNPSERRLKLKRFWESLRLKRIKRATFLEYKEEIKQIYLNCPNGYKVDHIVPLQGKIVSGLHVPWNLQYLTPTRNRRKNNKLLLPGEY